MVIYTHNRYTKSVSINNLPEEAWSVISGAETNQTEAMQFYKSVPFVYRCVDLRAKAVSKFPRDIIRNGQPIDEEKEPIFSNLDTLLYQIETALCIYAAAYLQKQQNLIDLLGVRWLAPQSIKPKFSEAEGLTHFERRIKKVEEPMRLELEDMIYFWVPPIDTDIGPGLAPVTVAINSAGILNSTTIFAKQFFDRGAVYPILLSVDGNPDRDEMDRLRDWWKRLLRGVKTAWETVAVRASVKPEIIGPPPGEMAMPELTSIQREDIATSLGVPHSLVLSNAANFATANQDVLNLYDNTIVPEIGLIGEVFNEQLFADLGLELIFRPERLEAYQWRNMQNGDSIRNLVDSKIIEKNEAREIIGFEPLEEEEEPPPAPPIPNIQDNLVMQLPQSPLEATRRIHLEQWERKAINRLRSGKTADCEFDSAAIEPGENEAIRQGLTLANSSQQVKRIFADYRAIQYQELPADDISTIISQVLKDLRE